MLRIGQDFFPSMTTDCNNDLAATTFAKVDEQGPANKTTKAVGMRLDANIEKEPQ